MTDKKFNIAEFKDAIHREIRPVVMSSLRSNDADHFKHKMQLRALYNNLNKIVNDISSEEVVCRYLGKETTRYARLVNTATEAFTNLQQMAVIYKLMH